MSITDVLLLLSGLAIFLYGMEVMGAGFKHMAGNKMQQILEKITARPVVGLLAGILVTAIIQSSGATTSMLVGFVNAGIMRVAQTVNVIMGANIGTTMTGQLMALNLDALAPLFAFVGVCLVMFFSQERLKALGEIFTGFGFLFIGMSTMGDAMIPLQSSEFFLGLITKLSNPLMGILVGFVITVVLQSSSASLGIIQTMAKNGLLGIKDVMFFNLGQKIGATTTSILASLGFNRDAKRVAIINFAFNVLGVAIFTVLYLVFPFDKIYTMVSPNNPVAQIAFMHTFTAVVSTVILFPFSQWIVKIAYLCIPDRGTKKKMQAEITQPAKTENNSAIILYGINVEVEHMFNLVGTNVVKSIQSILEHTSVLPEVEANEKEIDAINAGISHNLSILMASNITMSESLQASQLFSINVDLERIGDHALNLAQSGDGLVSEDKSLNMATYDELQKIYNNIYSSFDALNNMVSYDDLDGYAIIQLNEDKLDDYCRRYRKEEIKRIQTIENDDVESSVLFTEMLIDLERIGDHIMNIATSIYEGRR